MNKIIEDKWINTDEAAEYLGVKASKTEQEMITTDRAELEALLKRKQNQTHFG